VAKISEEDELEEIKKNLVQLAIQYKAIRLPNETEESQEFKKKD
jgi:hypothetical protein